MYAALHGLPGVPTASLDAMLDLIEIDKVGRSWKAAGDRNLDLARENAAQQRKGRK